MASKDTKTRTMSNLSIPEAAASLGGTPAPKKREFTEKEALLAVRQARAHRVRQEMEYLKSHGLKGKELVVKAEQMADGWLKAKKLPTGRDMQRLEEAVALGKDMNPGERAAIRTISGTVGSLRGILDHIVPDDMKGDSVKRFEGALKHTKNIADSAKDASSGFWEGGWTGDVVGTIADPAWWVSYGAGRAALKASKVKGLTGSAASRAASRGGLADDLLAGVAADNIKTGLETGGDLEKMKQNAILGVGGSVALGMFGRGVGTAWKKAFPDTPLPRSEAEAAKILNAAAPKQVKAIDDALAKAADDVDPKAKPDADNELAKLTDEGLDPVQAKRLTDVRTKEFIPKAELDNPQPKVTPDELAASVDDGIRSGAWGVRHTVSAARWAMEAVPRQIKTMREFAGLMMERFGRTIRKHIPDAWQRYKRFLSEQQSYRQRTAKLRSKGAIDPRSSKIDPESGLPRWKVERLKAKERGKMRREASAKRSSEQEIRQRIVDRVKKTFPANTPERGRYLTAVKNTRTPAGLEKMERYIAKHADEYASKVAGVKTRKLLDQRVFKSKLFKRFAKRDSGFREALDRAASLGVRDPMKGPTPADLARMSPEQRAGVVKFYIAAIDAYKAKLAGLSQKAVVSKEADAIAKEVTELGRKELKTNPGDFGERRSSLAKKFFRNESLQPERLMARMGENARKTFYETMNTIRGNQITTLRKYRDALEAKLEDEGILLRNRKWMKSVSGPKAPTRTLSLDGGRQLELNDAQYWSLLANLTDQSTMDLVDRGAKIALTSNRGETFSIKPEDLDVIDGAASEFDWAVVRAFKEVLNEKGLVKTDLNNVWQRLFGTDLTHSDDYFPRMVDIDPKVDPNTIGDLDQAFSAAKDGKIENRSFTKDRSGNPNNTILIGDIFHTTDRHLVQASAVAEMAVDVRRLRGIVQNKTFRDTVTKHYGADMVDSTDKFITRVVDDAAMIGRRRFDKDWLEGTYQIASKTVSNLAVGILGLNPFVVLKQIPSMQNAALEIHPKYLAQAMNDVGRPFSEARRGVFERMSKSPQIWARYEMGAARLVGDLGADAGLLKPPSSFQEAVMFGIKYADKNVIATIWRASEIKIKKTQPELDGDAYFNAVSKEADRVIRRTQPNFDMVNSSAIQAAGKANPALKLVSMFMSQRNTNYNILYEALLSGNKKKALAALAVVGVAQSSFIASVDLLRDWLYGRTEGAEANDILVGLATDTVANNLSQVYLGGEMGAYAARSTAKDLTGSKDFVFKPNSPMKSTVEGAFDSTRAAAKAAVKGDDERFWKNAKRSLHNTSALMGIPVRSPWRLIEETLEKFDQLEEDDAPDTGRPDSKAPKRPERPTRPR